MPYTINGSTGLPASGVKQADLAVGVVGVGPAFSAYQSVVHSLPSATVTKLLFQTEEFDTGNAYDAANSRFQPTVAGYYLITGGFSVSTTQTGLELYLYKTGVQFKSLCRLPSNTASSVYGSALIFLNGTTDYAELAGAQSAATQNTAAGVFLTFFQAHMVRAA